VALRTVVAGVGVAIVLLAIVIGLAVIGSPADERARRLDERRVRALQGLAGAVDEYWRVRGRLPQSIAELIRDPRAVTDTRDPVSGQEYVYRTVTDRTYQLCADFERQSVGVSDATLWAHRPGRHCFDLDVHERGR
jgi:type II secretory pathway pseudopilin PulG